MEKIPVKQVRIDPNRQREDLGDIGDLAGSFGEFGQLQPIIIDQDNILVAGYRRLMAAMAAGWEEVGYERQNDLTPTRRKEIELEENIRRKQLDWREETKAIKEIHDMRKRADPSWTMAKTGEIIGKTQALVSYAVDLASNLHRPEVAQAETMLGAIGRLQSIKKAEAKRSEAKVLSQYAPRKYDLRVGDALQLIPEVPDESVDAIITNPPFGVDLDFKGTRPYADEPDDIKALLKALIPHFYRVMRDSSWIVIFFDVLKIFWLADELRKAGFDVNELPHFWIKPNKTQGVLRNPNTDFIVAYEAFLVGRKGEATLYRKGRQNTWTYDTPPHAERVHTVQMPVDFCEELAEVFTVGGQVVFDPFTGSGSIPLGALNKQRHALAFELNPDYAARADQRLSEA